MPQLPERKPSIHDVCDFIIHRATAGGVALSHIKLQKLLYYVQAWKLAFDEQTLFDGKFQAWVHGPVNREIYDRFVSTKSLYSPVCAEDMRSQDFLNRLSEDDLAHIENVLETYMAFSGTQLEEMTHKEQPWIEARVGLPDNARCGNHLDEKTMMTFYRSRLD